ASTSVVLPWSTWATMATLRISERSATDREYRHVSTGSTGHQEVPLGADTVLEDLCRELQSSEACERESPRQFVASAFEGRKQLSVVERCVPALRVEQIRVLDGAPR